MEKILHFKSMGMGQVLEVGSNREDNWGGRLKKWNKGI